MDIQQFSELKHAEMRAYMQKNQISLKGKTRKSQFVQVYKQYLVEHLYQEKLQKFNNCGDSDIKCMLFALGMSEDKYHSLLMLNCDRICTQKQQKTAVPLAAVVDPSRNKVVGVQTPEGITPIRETSIPPNKPVIPITNNSQLLAEIRQSKKQPRRLLSAVPENNDVTVKPLSETSLLMGLKNFKLKPVKRRDETVKPDKSEEDVSSLLQKLTTNIRTSVASDDEEEEEEEEEWDTD
jgi:hypothetical protein